MAAGFNNQLAVVFGGGRDIGGAIAVELAKRGAQVALSYGSSDPTKVLAAIEATGQKAFAQKVDALGRGQPFSTPIRFGVSTEPIGPT